MKTPEELLNEAIVKYNAQVNDMSKFKLSKNEVKMFTDVMEDYRKQGNYFTPDEICKVQEAAYEAGFQGAMAEKG